MSALSYKAEELAVVRSPMASKPPFAFFFFCFFFFFVVFVVLFRLMLSKKKINQKENKIKK
ncbi:hypothetical protein, partial [Corynebacterium diphtheriae]|uniref:hypothetical protein n=1 Tax=Corynebacterium diphtheriae TaxID=1717 RepID=UPI001C63151D